MTCAGRGLLQSVMTKGNKQLQLGHSGSCCGAPSYCSSYCCCMHFGAETNDGPEASNGGRKPTKQTMNDNNRRRRCLQLLPELLLELLLCMCAPTGCGLFFRVACVDKTSIHKCQLVLVRCSCCSSCLCSSLELLQRKLKHFNIILQPKEAIEETFATRI